MSEEIYSLNDSIGYNVRNFNRALKVQIVNNFRESKLDVKIEEWITLAYLNEHSDKNQIQLGDLLMQDKTAVTRLLDVLEEKKQIKRIIDKRDKRNRIVKITPEGKKAYLKILPVVERTIAQAKAGVSDKDYKTTIASLQKMTANLLAL
jgi:DNA-binding MarR family transcriptional regulator